MNLKQQQIVTGGVSPACLRKAAAALAAKDTERLWTLLDQEGVAVPDRVARALTAGSHQDFLRDLLKRLPAAQRATLGEVIAYMLEARPVKIAVLKMPPTAAVQALQAGNSLAFLTAANAARESVSSVLVATVDAVAHSTYPLLFQREISLISLQFDHLAAASPRSALHLRRDGRTKVTRPEWVSGKVSPADCPVLYAADFNRAGTVVIKAKFHANSPLSTKGCEVRALEGGVLGEVEAFAVSFAGQTDMTIEVPLNHLALNGPSKSDVSWRWQYRIGTGAWRFLARTPIRVYCTPKKPNAPWDLSAFDLRANPWTDALDFACQAANWYGIDEMDGLAASLCELLNPGGIAPNPFRLAYTVNDPGTPHYTTTDGALDLSALFERYKGGAGNGELVNCDDCAGLVVSFANLLGCDLYEQYILTSAMHPVIPIGEGQWWTSGLGFQPSFGAAGDGILTYHRVAWRGSNADDALVFDITWLLNGFADPDNPEQPHPEVRTPWYAYAERFKVAGQLDYIGRLHPAFGWQLGAKTRRGIS